LERKNEQPVETNGIVYRRAKTWRVALAGMQFRNRNVFLCAAWTGELCGKRRVWHCNSGGWYYPDVQQESVDGITDPIIAIIIDKMNTRFGKIRILMAAGWLIESLAVLIMYCWASGKGHGIVLFVLLYCLYVIGYTMCNVTAQDRSGDAYERPEAAPDGRRLEYSLQLSGADDS